jgi:radical SAM protein with 4Fe4S-binding SPASM domain
MPVTLSTPELAIARDDARSRAVLQPRRPRARRTFDAAPLLVFWEMTSACDDSREPGRARTSRSRARDELTESEARSLIDQLAALGSPRPILVLTGGDCLMRPDFMDLVAYAATSNVALAVAATLTERLDEPLLHALRRHGVKTVSLGIEGANAVVHDGRRGRAGHFDATLVTVATLLRCGFTVQINTTVVAANVEQLADVAALMHALRIDVWELSFFVDSVAGSVSHATTSQQNEDVCHFLIDASRFGFEVRTVEAPFFRRVAEQRRDRGGVGGSAGATGPLYARLHDRLVRHLGEPLGPPRLTSAQTRDGRGTIFVAANGDVCPSAQARCRLGSIREQGLGEIYRDHATLQRIRRAEFNGACGTCPYAQLCGGSRARAWRSSGDLLGSDPGCLMVQSVLHDT